MDIDDIDYIIDLMLESFEIHQSAEDYANDIITIIAFLLYLSNRIQRTDVSINSCISEANHRVEFILQKRFRRRIND